MSFQLAYEIVRDENRDSGSQHRTFRTLEFFKDDRRESI
jgi:hypothetical protein